MSWISGRSAGIDVSAKSAWLDICKVPLVGVTDAKDTCDRISQDTGFGTQKSLCFTAAKIRQTLRRPNTTMRWTPTANMFVDAGAKWMDGWKPVETSAEAR